jgi:succinate-semialdehyde dehydrogenase/glutarate-semialdehyde dehydrogenase
MLDQTKTQLNLKNPDLLREQAYIDGAWSDADSGETFDVTNPADGSLVATVPQMTASEAQRAVDAASRAWPEWRARTAKDRASILKRWHGLLMENQDDLAAIMTADLG